MNSRVTAGIKMLEKHSALSIDSRPAEKSLALYLITATIKVYTWKDLCSMKFYHQSHV